MADTPLAVTPKTKVGELLDAYPQLEPVLFELSPSFAKLRNPILRKTVARVASLSQAAAVGGLKVDALVNRLRAELGQPPLGDAAADAAYLSAAPPAWLDETKITDRYDARPVIDGGGSPMAEILSRAKALPPGGILEFLAPFVPAPVLDMLKEQGYLTCSLQRADGVANYAQKA